VKDLALIGNKFWENRPNDLKPNDKKNCCQSFKKTKFNLFLVCSPPPPPPKEKI
jgi:hypothetical protein